MSASAGESSAAAGRRQASDAAAGADLVAGARADAAAGLARAVGSRIGRTRCGIPRAAATVMRQTAPGVWGLLRVAWGAGRAALGASSTRGHRPASRRKGSLSRGSSGTSAADPLFEASAHCKAGGGTHLACKDSLDYPGRREAPLARAGVWQRELGLVTCVSSAEACAGADSESSAMGQESM